MSNKKNNYIKNYTMKEKTLIKNESLESSNEKIQVN